MYPVEPTGAAHRHPPRRRTWPWWLLIAAAVGMMLSVPTLRAAISGAEAGGGANPATMPATGYAPGAAAHQHDPVQVAVTGPATGPLPAGYVMAPGGPMGPADREFLTKVRQAGLWEGPAGQMAQTRAADPRVKEVGAQLATDHRGLDAQVRQVAGQVGVPLPDKPSDEQQGWLNELNGKFGAEFDATFANRLRAAHGKVFALVSSIRSGTRNDLVRTFAQTAVNVVMKHMALLESIGNVDFGALPTPGLPPATPATAGPGAVFAPDAAWAVAGLALLVGAVAAFRIYRGARRRPPF